MFSACAGNNGACQHESPVTNMSGMPAALWKEYTDGLGAGAPK